MPRLLPRWPTPWIARLTAPGGPPVTRLVQSAGAEVMAIPGRYCVTYLLLGEGTIAIVDVGSHADVARVLAALEWLGRPASQVRFVIPSHLHFDHVMGIDALAKRIGAPIALGRVASEHVREGRELRWPSIHQLPRGTVTWIYQGMPVLPVDDWRHGIDFGMPWGKDRFTAPLGEVLVHGGELSGLPGWRVLEAPGHADEALCLHHAEAGFLVAGDNVRNFLGGEWNPILCDRAAYARTREQLLGLNVSTVFPGHGPLLEGKGILRRLRTIPPYLT